ncbi:3-oxoacyl-ACP synthase [Catellatospora sp. TT07R-123]|uniref:3-oxoacyl-[acyl-carrier-protein] synthase III C-terminal domain-containing protein n=1 Tax=Catellatospora sp. TT07R-123 TaxID=2733863 RepID=UPI001B0193C5|nr:3-oxoacyl-[acyl-carrier-protein] synthase III C-terminal domain-containing protein [Catellatospora sp. TT07R-123]GHJ48864.1 3-oxoacyl-ACP synthase [Catellatospora sp. TT07R-123]
MSTTLTAVAAYLPETEFTLEEAAEVLGLSDQELKRYRRFFGLDRVRWAPQARQADLLVEALRRLPDLDAHRSRIRYAVHARTIEPTGPYAAQPLHEALAAVGLGHVQAFAISQHACASGLLSVDLAGRLLTADGDPDALVLVLTGEKTYPHVARFMPAAMVMGESSAACLVGLDGARDRVLAYTTRTFGEFHAITARSGPLAAQFEQMYIPALADLITDTVAAAAAGLTLADLRLVLPHNVNRISWTRLGRLLDLPLDRLMLDNIARTGHCFCADPFINYVRALELGLLRPGDHYLMASVGLGATFSAMLLRH